MNVMALVSESRLRALEAQYGPLEHGRVWPIDTFRSKRRGMKMLRGGRALFLVTVRDNALWLLGALDHPVFDGTSWTAKPNTLAACDAHHVIPQLRFLSGKGIVARPERLASALEKPRALAPSDAELFRALARAAVTS